jgi:type VI secretion system secreted protein Hcp
VAEIFVLRIEGIEGDCVLEGHAGAIDVIGWSWGVARASGPGHGGGGAGTGRPDFDDLHVAAAIGKASPALVESCVTGRHHRTAVLTGLRPGERLLKFLEYEFSDVTITSVEHGDADEAPPVEEFSIDYRTFEIRHTAQKVDGSIGTTVDFSYDISKAKPT